MKHALVCCALLLGACHRNAATSRGMPVGPAGRGEDGAGARGESGPSPVGGAAGGRNTAVLVEDFDGANPVGTWDPHGPLKSFSFRVREDGLEMHDAGGANQHVTRRDLSIDATRPYRVEARFSIAPDRPGMAPGVNSFCINFLVQGERGSASDLDHLYAHSVNLDVLDGGAAGAVMKHMGFVDGAFQEIGQTQTRCCRSGVEYRLRVDVNVDEAGARKIGVVTVSLLERERVHERFTADYSRFPWQPDRTQPVRVGVNTHGADWVMRHFRVAYLGE